MVLPKNIEITPSLDEIRKGTRPKEIRITTYMDGMFGPMENTTIWLTQFDHEVESFREDIIFKEGWFNTGRSSEPLMPWEVSYSHMVNIRKIGQIMFKRKRFAKVFLYGSRDIYSGLALHLASGRDNDSGKDVGLLLANSKDAELWPVVVRLFEDRDITLTGTKELTPKEARRIAYPSLGPSKTVDKARENSLRLKYQLSRLLSDVSRGKAAMTKVERLDDDMRATVEKWSSKV